MSRAATVNFQSHPLFEILLTFNQNVAYTYNCIFKKLYIVCTVVNIT